MEANVKRVRIWEGSSGKDGFGASVLPFIARVELLSPAVRGRMGPAVPMYELLILSPECGSTAKGPVVVVPSSGNMEKVWTEFVAATGFDGTGLAGDVAERFAAYVNGKAA